ncbi:3180_t:CDS:10 [Dentiscutata erythropus]|uniref:3180_t:CDS:1 n=1 Tax=Dentiscutata erythropus TaxID=1348616 RepID=A0A9N9BU66_9GLOM|nr:3180_t:CDS:10 [Dentiscutata erythropus]
MYEKLCEAVIYDNPSDKEYQFRQYHFTLQGLEICEFVSLFYMKEECSIGYKKFYENCYTIASNSSMKNLYGRNFRLFDGNGFFAKYDHKEWNYRSFCEYLSDENIQISDIPHAWILNLEYVKNNVKKYSIKKYQVEEILRKNKDGQINNFRKSHSSSSLTSEENDLVDAPLFGGDSIKLANGQTIREIILPLYNKAELSDLLKIGIIYLDQQVQPSDICEAISIRIDEAKQIMSIEEANRMLKSWYQQDDLFTFNFELSMQNLIRKLVERNLGIGTLSIQKTIKAVPCSSTHLLIYSTINSIRELLANKDRRNCSKTRNDKLARAMIPDITISNLKHNVEFFIIENGKLQSIDDKKKVLNDTFKSCTLLHDILRKIHNEITFHDAQSVKIFETFKVFAIVISAGKELYVFQKIAECSLPTRVQNCDLLNKTITTLIKLRILSNKNFVIYDSLHQQSRSTSPPQLIKLTRDVGMSPYSIIKKAQSKNRSKRKKTPNSNSTNDIEQSED